MYKSSSSGTSVFAYDGTNLTEETNSSGTVVARYAQGTNIDEPLAMLRSSTTSYYDADGLGSITSLTNISGTATKTYTYGSFGTLSASAGSVTNPFQYTGRESDPELGLYYYRARYYDSTDGRFISEDPIRQIGGVNFYRYVKNNPANLIDPLGLWPSGATIGGTIGTVVGGIIGGTLGIGAGALGGTLVAPGVGTIGGGTAGGIQGAVIGATTGGLVGLAIGQTIDNLLKRIPPPTCKYDQEDCAKIDEFFDNTADPHFRICVYSCPKSGLHYETVPATFSCPLVAHY